MHPCFEGKFENSMLPRGKHGTVLTSHEGLTSLHAHMLNNTYDPCTVVDPASCRTCFKDFHPRVADLHMGGLVPL